MGACVIQSSAKRDQPLTEKEDSLLRPGLDVQDLPSSLMAITKKKKSSPISTASTFSLKQNINTLEDRLMDQQLELEEWKNQHNSSSSVILKRPNKKKRNPQAKKEENEAIQSLVSQLRANGDIDGNVIQERDLLRLTIGNLAAHIEFLLPKSRGGPLVVPYLLYQNYST